MGNPTGIEYLSLGLIVSLGCVLALKRWRRGGPSYPPGPRPLLVIGNLLDMPNPSNWPWLRFGQWADLYGDVVHLKVFGQHIIILNSVEACEDLLVKRSAQYSDRPVLPMVTMAGWADSLGLVQYGERLRKMRRLITNITNPRSVLGFVPIVEERTTGFLKRLSRAPDSANLKDHARWLSGGMILKVVYGYTIAEQDDPFIRNADRAVSNFAQAGSPGWLVDFMPFLQYLPRWLPGTASLRLADQWRDETNLMFDEPFEWFQREWAAGEHAENSLMAMAFQENPDAHAMEAIKFSLGSMYGGGSDTTVFEQLSFFLAMTLYPEVQARAQGEIDSVTGGVRLPNWDDLPQLPYLHAITKELHRWKTIVPNGVPHCARQDDEYRGWKIPAGTMIITNMWYMSQNRKVYRQPELFKPERFLGPSPEPDPSAYTFGFGRRECPGRHLTSMTLILAIAKTLALFDIVRAKDANGNDILVAPEFTSTTISQPPPFECRIVPRIGATELLRSLE